MDILGLTPVHTYMHTSGIVYVGSERDLGLESITLRLETINLQILRTGPGAQAKGPRVQALKLWPMNMLTFGPINISTPGLTFLYVYHT